ncbi:hypothetical protein ABIA39_005690 [Nocardia sp. GAS34]
MFACESLSMWYEAYAESSVPESAAADRSRYVT